MSLQRRFLAVDAEMRLCAALIFYTFCNECVAVVVVWWARVSMNLDSLDGRWMMAESIGSLDVVG